MAYTIMVAVDGEPGHRAALDWASVRAAREEARLELVHVVERSFADSGEQPGRMLTLAGRSLVAAEEKYALRHTRVAEVRARVLVGHPVRDVAAVSAGAALLVVGIPPAPDRQRALAGSLAVHVAAAADCTVAAVPHGWREGGRGIVVGVDGDRPTEPAVDFAAAEAVRLGEPLTIVCAAAPVPGREPSAADRRGRIVGAAAERARRLHPGLTVIPAVVDTTPSRALVSASEGARMVVLGTHDRHGVKRIVLGSVGHDVLLNADLPVVVVRARDGRPAVSPSSDPEPA